MPAPTENAQVVAVASANEAEAVMLDFVHPLRPGWDHVGGRRKARLNEAGRTTGGRCGAPQHGFYDAYLRSRQAVAWAANARDPGLDPFDTHTQLAQYYRRYMAKPL